MLRFIDYLLSNYDTPEIKALVDSTEIWICPLVNPDGTYFGGDSTITEATGRTHVGWYSARRFFSNTFRSGTFRTYYPNRLQTGWVALFGY